MSDSSIQRLWTSRVALSVAFSVCVAIILGAATALRLVDINRNSLDSDETFSLTVSAKDTAAIFQEARADKVHPPLYYLLLHEWLTFGKASESWIRSFSVLAGCLGLLLLIPLSTRLGLPRPYILYLLLLSAVSDYLIFYADHARMYSLVASESALCILTLERWLTHPTRARLAAYSAMAMLLVTTHYFGWLILAAQGCLALIFFRDRIPRFVLALLPAVALSLSWTLYVVFGPRIVGETDVVAHLGHLVFERPTISSLVGLLARMSGGSPSSHVIGTGLSLLCGSIVVAALVRLCKSGRETQEFRTVSHLALCCVVPPVVAFLISVGTDVSIWHQRYLIVVSLPYLLLVGYSIVKIPWIHQRRIIAAAVIILSAASFIGSRESQRKLDWSGLVTYLAGAGPMYPVLTIDPYVEHALAYYLSQAQWSTSVQMTNLDTVHPATASWVEFNTATWKEAKVLSMLDSHGVGVGAPHCVDTPWEKVCVVLVWPRTPALRASFSPGVPGDRVD